jgi:hypothetical protein
MHTCCHFVSPKQDSEIGYEEVPPARLDKTPTKQQRGNEKDEEDNESQLSQPCGCASDTTKA